MSDQFKLPPAKTLEEANAQRDSWVKTAHEFAILADNYKSLLQKHGVDADPVVKGVDLATGQDESAIYTPPFTSTLEHILKTRNVYVEDNILEKPIQLKIQCRFTDGELRIGYVRKQDGTEVNFNDGTGKFLFYINATINLKDLTPNNTTLNGHIERN